MSCFAYLLNRTAEFVRLVHPSNAVSQMVSLVSELRPDSCVVAEVRASPNHNERKNDMEPDTIVLHYTGTRDIEDRIRQLCTPGSEISAHYVVLQDGYIIQLVPEMRRAWHAAVSSWAGDTDLNSRSIGIEIANPGHEHGYPDFPRRQIAAVTTLCRSILTRYDVPADRVLAHSDVAPARNVDPGEKFPWKLLANSGIGLWVKPVPLTQGGPINVLGETDPAIEEVQRLLARYGYGVAATGYFDSTTRDAVAAFQRRFRPMRVDGVVDASTIATLRALIAERDAWLSRSTTAT
ncbi:MAG TPA: N-acetylmuramoyl-L-alanine amidase [Candidatus Acidoferrum sp.]|nr:N-acetylmuramoyl-L-alanine amidase [Candidatus Acidoferrum sp.]